MGCVSRVWMECYVKRFTWCKKAEELLDTPKDELLEDRTDFNRKLWIMMEVVIPARHPTFVNVAAAGLPAWFLGQGDGPYDGLRLCIVGELAQGNKKTSTEGKMLVRAREIHKFPPKQEEWIQEAARRVYGEATGSGPSPI